MTKNGEEYDDTVMQRLGMWEIGKDIISSNPILGAGINASHFINITLEDFDGHTWHSFHNAYLQQAVETGLVGLAIYIWIFIIMIIEGLRLYKYADNWFHKSLGLGLVACVLACMAGNIAGSYWNYFSVVGYMYVIAAIVMQPHTINEKSTDFKHEDKLTYFSSSASQIHLSD
jgi:O-antigen ligase